MTNIITGKNNIDLDKIKSKEDLDKVFRSMKVNAFKPQETYSELQQLFVFAGEHGYMSQKEIIEQNDKILKAMQMTSPRQVLKMLREKAKDLFKLKKQLKIKGSGVHNG